MLKFEFPEPETSECECCGGVSTRLTRFVSKDNEAFAIYYAAFGNEHPDKRIVGVVSFGEWWVDDDIPKTRIAFAFELWSDDEEYKVGIIDVADSPWADVDILGHKLSRAEALEHPDLPDVFHITDHMTSDDPAIIEFFETPH